MPFSNFFTNMNCDVCSKAPNSAISCKNYFPYLTLVKKSHWKGFILCLPLFLFRARIGLFLKTTIFIQSAGDKKKKKKIVYELYCECWKD